MKRRQRRTININAQFKQHIQACYEAIHPRSLDRPCFISQKHGEPALIKLSELFNHSSASITRIYLGIKEEEMLSTYDMLEF